MLVEITHSHHGRRTVEVEDGARVRDAANRAGYSVEGCTVTVNSAPATGETLLAPGAAIMIAQSVKGGTR